jgi:hypothetical protein
VNPAIERAARSVLDDWRREAAGSRQMAESHEQRVLEEDVRAARLKAEHARIAAEHRADAERAERVAAEIEDALRAEGLEP